jgi:viroplasmin and RNaseH domain-containing protein
MSQSHQMSKSDYKSHNANRNGLVFAVRRGRKAPVIFKTWNSARKPPRALAERYLEFERDEDAREFAKLHPAQSRNRADHTQDRYSQDSSPSSPTGVKRLNHQLGHNGA